MLKIATAKDEFVVENDRLYYVVVCILRIVGLVLANYAQTDQTH